MTPLESNTKDRIIEAAIDLFSTNGYFETSVRELAEKCNLKVSSLYSHFSSKEEILDAILDIYQRELINVRIPQKEFDFIINNYSPEDILSEGFTKIIETTSSSRMNKIIKILVIELYRNTKVREFYKQWYLNENRFSIMRIFESLQKNGSIKKIDLELLTSMYHALLNYYYHEYFMYVADNKDPAEITKNIKKHIKLFVELIK